MVINADPTVVTMVPTWLSHEFANHLVQSVGLGRLMVALAAPLTEKGQICLVFTVRTLALLLVMVHMHEQSHQGLLPVSGPLVAHMLNLVL